MHRARHPLPVRGLSPHTRGNQPRRRPRDSRPGSIPAHTGEPCSNARLLSVTRVYPRTHGGTARGNQREARLRGLSPHTRGNHGDGRRRARPRGSIPAHTGEPAVRSGGAGLTRVYPRTHGGTAGQQRVRAALRGLSPHTRGNRRADFGRLLRGGSIPAHTGEPGGGMTAREADRVYPRTHGGTSKARARIRTVPGLSPHTRGNRSVLPERPVFPGSIPAHTGEPKGVIASTAAMAVYPRTHGGTGVDAPQDHSIQGLSPHTRGNPRPERLSPVAQGSIPAHTGEPRPAAACCRRRRVYPRTHGGTNFFANRNILRPGLSPHTRGNRSPACSAGADSGSIPAHTGEPDASIYAPTLLRVYPRTHGGTRGPDGQLRPCSGLSPHTRGNPAARQAEQPSDGSIPAHTGEPSETPMHQM